jgi:2-amino-4-hydroxy-6-hydroxymethyldihydropteridine diphosphokinase
LFLSLSVFISVHLWFHSFCMADSVQIYLSLGSNLGDRLANLESAITALSNDGVSVLRRSSLYETEPVDFLSQPWFLNCVVEGETQLAPLELLHALQGIERKLGSKKLVPKGPRIIDLDILFYGATSIHTEEIEIPHPRLSQRRFVLVPLAELAPMLRHPVLHCTVGELLAATQDKSDVRLWAPQAIKNH